MRFLFCSLASRGFLYPCVGIAEELLRRGHKIAFVTDGSFRVELEQLGLQRIPRSDSDDGASFWVKHWSEPLAILIQAKHIEYAIRQFLPDVLIGQHLTLGPLLVRQRQGVPLALIGSVTYLWPTDISKVTLPDSHSDLGTRRFSDLKSWRFNDMFQILKEAQRLVGCDISQEMPEENPLLGDLFMLRTVPELEKDFKKMPQQVRLIGACLWEPAQVCQELEGWLKNAIQLRQPVMYVHQGRFFQFPHFWPDLVRVASEEGISVAASTQMMDCNVGQIPQSFFVREHVPQSQVLRHASIAVLSANATAALGALTSGVPSLLIPAGGEQPDIAELCATNGSARLLYPHDVTAEALRNEIHMLLTDHRIQHSAGALSAAFSRINSAKVTADLLEGLASRRSLTSRSDNVSFQPGLSA